MATLVVPRLFERRTSPMETFIEELQNLVQAGSFEALTTGRAHRVTFDFSGNRNVILEISPQKNSQKNADALNYVPVSLTQTKTNIEIPSEDDVEFQHLFIENKDELSGGLTTKKTWFYINAEGMVQEVAVVLADKKTGAAASLVSNPFSGQLVKYEGVKKS